MRSLITLAASVICISLSAADGGAQYYEMNCGDPVEDSSPACGESEESVSSGEGDLCLSPPAEDALAATPFTLQEHCNLDERGIFITGHLQQGLNLNGRSPLNPPEGFGNSPAAGTVYRADDYLLNQLYVSMGRAADKSTCRFGYGYQVDLVYGTDYVFLQSLGLETEGDGTNRWNDDTGTGFLGKAQYGLAMPQLFVEFANEDFSLKLGHFYNIVGHEELIPTENFYYTANYPLFFNGFGESVPVTGVLAEVRLTPQWLVAGGLHRGQGKWEDNNNHLNAIGMVEWSSCAKDMYLTYTFDIGAEDDAGENTIYAQSVIFEWQFEKNWGYTLNSSYGFEENVATGGDTASWYGFAHYLAHTLSGQLTIGLRYDYFNDVDGTRVFPRAGFPANAPGAYHAVTLGANYVPHPNWTLRPAVRWDWFAADGDLPPGPFDNGTERSQFMAVVDLVTTF